MSKKVLFRFDASPAIGSGHAVRCLTLATALHAAGWEIAIGTEERTRFAIPRIFNGSLINMSLADSAVSIGERVGNVDLLVIDHYALDTSFEVAAKAWAGTVMVINDVANRAHAADVLLDQTPGRTLHDYEECLPATSAALLGPDYALLRPQFAAARKSAFVKRSGIKCGVERVLVSVGGSDPTSILPLVMAAISEWESSLTIDLVLGGDTPIPQLQGNFGGRLNIYRNVSDMASLMVNADLAVGAGGVSSLERCCLGLPSLLLITAENQRLMGERMAGLGAAHVLGLHENISSANLLPALRGLVADADVLQAMAMAAFRVCDGLGVKRVVDYLCPYRLPTGEAVRLRRASANDSCLLHEWQLQPGIRKYFRTTTPPSLEEHREWFFSRLGDPLCVINIIEIDGIPCGVVRMEPLEMGEIMEVSLLISNAFQGRGLGKAALKLASEFLPWAALCAEVHRENHRSRAIFEAAGFSSNDGIYFFSRREQPPPFE